MGRARAQTQHPPATTGATHDQGAGDPFRQQADAGGNLPKRTARALLDVEDPAVVPDHPRSREDERGRRRGVLFPGLRIGAPVLQVGLATQAMLYHVGAQCVLPPGYLCCGYPQTAAGNARQGPAHHYRQPRAVPSRGQHAELPRHQDGDRLVRNLHGPAAEVRIREDLPGLPPARHPRVPGRERRGARGGGRGSLHVPRSLPYADEDPPAAQGGQPR